MITILILDDELNAIEALRTAIEKNITEKTEIFSTTNPEEAQRFLDEKKPNLLFLDVEMPSMSGFEFLSRQKEKNFEVIFSTAYSKYAIQAIRFSAIDFLLKPVQPDELVAAFNRFRTKPSEKHHTHKMYEHLFENLNSNNEKHFKLSLSKGNRTWFIPPAEIFYCAAYSNYTNMYLKDQTEFTVSKTLKEVEEMLSVHNFIRTHKSFLVNKDHVLTLENAGNLLLKNYTRIEISRRRMETVKQELGLAN